MAKKDQVRNFSTTISAAKTAGDIQRLLAENGASKVMLEYDSEYEPTAISFALIVNKSEQFFRLPVDPPAMLHRLKEDKRVARKNLTLDQAKRVAWRNVLMWVEGQIEFVKDRQVKMEQIMLPFMLVAENKTVWDQFVNSQDKLIGG